MTDFTVREAHQMPLLFLEEGVVMMIVSSPTLVIIKRGREEDEFEGLRKIV